MNLLWRLGILVVLMAVVAWLDWRRHGANATRWREYSFLLAAGFLGGLFGVVIDHITATISPEYFTLGKGIKANGGFRLQVTELGFHAGLLAGVIVGGAYLMANNPKPNRRSLRFLRLFRFALYPILAALVLMPISSLVGYLGDPLGFTSDLCEILTPPQTERFLAVWGIHLGIYAGGMLGTIWGVIGIRRARNVSGAFNADLSPVEVPGTVQACCDEPWPASRPRRSSPE